MTNCKYKLRKLSIGLVSVGTMFMAAPVMGEDASQPTASRETSSASSATTSSTTQSGEYQGRQGGDLKAPKSTPQETSPSAVTAMPAESSNKEEKAPVEAQGKETAPKAPAQAEVASPAGKAAATTNTGQPTNTEEVLSRSKRSAEAAQAMEAETMEVDKLEVDNESSKLTVKDGEKDKQLIKNRDGKQRDIFDVSREVKINEDGTLDVTLSVKPKQIDEGAEVIVLLDVSNKMTKENKDTAKENIKKLVDTLTSKAVNGEVNHNARNSVRLITFYNKINEPVELNSENVYDEVDKAWVYAQEARNWGVNLQGAIHKARDIFNKEKTSGKRQHIVLFSQGESTFSYDIKEETKKELTKVQIDEPVTYTNPLLPWPFYFDTTTRTHNVVEDAGGLIDFLNKVGITQFKDALKGVASTGNGALSLLKGIFRIKNPLDYITLADLDTKNLTEDKFDYEKRLGEGYNFRSYADRKVGTVELKNILKAKIQENLTKIKPEEVNSWLELLGMAKTSENIQDWMIDKVLDKLFYHRQYQFYNHNLSAQAEAQMARDEGIIFRSFDVTMPNSSTRTKRSTDQTDSEKRNEKFDKYLKEMSEGGNFFTEIDKADKFKDILTQLIVKETFEENVNVQQSSWKVSTNSHNDRVKNNDGIEYKSASSSSSLFSLLLPLPSTTKESLTWTISKEKLKEAFENRLSLTLTYKLKVHKDKFKPASQKREKRSIEASEISKSVTAKAISNEISYKINETKANGNNKLEDVKLTYRREMVPVPEIIEEIVNPIMPSTPENSIKEDSIIESGPVLEFIDENTVDGIIVHGDYSEGTVLTTEEDTKLETSTPITTGGQSDPIDIVEDTQSGMSGDNSHTDGTVLEEDSKPSQEDEVIIGSQDQVIDFIEDTQSGMSGDNSHTNGTVLEEDSKPSQEAEVIIGGQGQVIDFTEDTQTGMSGAGQVENPTITEETHEPEIIMGGQSDPIDMVEDTLPGMSGSNEATVVEEDTRPKLQFHFDNEEPVPATVPTVSQAPIAQVESKVPHAKAESALPQTGDTNKLETFFTITALTVIGAAGLLGKKRRDNQTD
ncbi:serum opacification factor [Streptococcus dysgalactiae]|uniref:serum opacification factor n=1 Tax=Streptococcus dysgalactiae TaxID=1334 RepID=UPI0024B78420|nr:serum opacification factor [Streptococcus dysgalactiae]